MHPKHRFLTRSLITVLAVTLLFTAGVGFTLLSLRRFEAGLVKTDELSSLANGIRYYDVVLTETANRAALSSNPDLKLAYESDSVQLGVLLERAREMSPDAAPLIDLVDEANRKLTVLERSVFDLIANSQTESARTILSSETYASYKTLYASGLKQLLNRLHSDRALLLTQLKSDLYTSLGLVILLFFGVLVLMLLTYYSLNRQMRLENLMTDISNRMVSTPEGSSEEDYIWVIERLAKHFNAGLGYLLLHEATEVRGLWSPELKQERHVTLDGLIQLALNEPIQSGSTARFTLLRIPKPLKQKFSALN